MKANAITEAEAAGKWCPDARAPVALMSGDAPNSIGNREHWRMPENSACIASRCMAWRWISGNEQAGTGRGYCGRAGRP
jgi:hypothetical protein